MTKVYTNKYGQKAIRYSAKDRAKQAERKEYQLRGYQFSSDDTRNQGKRITQFLCYYADLSSTYWPTLKEVQTKIAQIETCLSREYSTDLNVASHARQSVILMPTHTTKRGEKLQYYDYEYLRHWRNRIVHFGNELRFWRTLEYIAIHHTHPLYYVIKQ